MSTSLKTLQAENLQLHNLIQVMAQRLDELEAKVSELTTPRLPKAVIRLKEAVGIESPHWEKVAILKTNGVIKISVAKEIWANGGQGFMGSIRSRLIEIGHRAMFRNGALEVTLHKQESPPSDSVKDEYAV